MNEIKQFYENLIATNPCFAKFVEDNKGLTWQEVAKKYNINIDDEVT